MSNKPYEVEQELQRRAKKAYADITTPSDLAKRLRERTRHPRLVGDTRTIRLLEKAAALLDVREGCWVARCQVTGNPFGTDTWAEGWSCPCKVCQAMLAAKGDGNG